MVKKSTRKHYAMKIQHKSELLRSFERNLTKLDNEKVWREKSHTLRACPVAARVACDCHGGHSLLWNGAGGDKAMPRRPCVRLGVGVLAPELEQIRACTRVSSLPCSSHEAFARRPSRQIRRAKHTYGRTPSGNNNVVRAADCLLSP